MSMSDRIFSPGSTIVRAALLTMAGMVIGPRAIAQTLPDCQPPATGEYLILVLNQTETTPTQLQQTLPPSATTTVCNYLGRSVTRVGGFTDADTASSWVQYLTDIGGMEAFVARPPVAAQSVSLPASSNNGLPSGEPIAVNPPDTLPPAMALPSLTPSPIQPSPSPTAAPPLTTAATGFSPQPLGDGYAVLVDYFNRPELANQVQQVLSRPVGLVSYNQRPYLLALYTGDVAIATDTLRALSDRNFTAVVVDSRQTILLTSTVALP